MPELPQNPKYNVLMLGWEFYPVFAGGMGVVTSEIVHGLTDANIGVHFVIPKLPKKIVLEKGHITSAKDYKAKKTTIRRLEENQPIRKTYVETNFSPYDTKNIAPGYDNSNAVHDQAQGENATSENNNPASIYDNTFKEIDVFEDKTAQIAMESNFELIHAHEWLTFRAALRAKEITGKPVVLHVHATETDRSGDNPNPFIFDIDSLN